MAKYAKCPRCELNYIDTELQEYCDICLAEMKGSRFQFPDLTEEEEEMEICPICGENMMRVGEKMCDECKKKGDYEEEDDLDPEKDDGWRDFVDDETEDLDLPDVPDAALDDEGEEDEMYEGEEEEEDYDYVTADEAESMAREGEDDEADDDDDF